MVKATSIITGNHSAKIILALSKAALIQKDTHAHLNQTKSLENINPVSIPTPKMIFFDIDDTLSRGGQLPRGF